MKRPQRRKASESKAFLPEAVVGGVLSTCSVPITNNPDSPIGVPQVLFTGRYLSTDLPQFDVTSDGQRFVMVRTTSPRRCSSLVFPPEVLLLDLAAHAVPMTWFVVSWDG